MFDPVFQPLLHNFQNDFHDVQLHVVSSVLQLQISGFSGHSISHILLHWIPAVIKIAWFYISCFTFNLRSHWQSKLSTNTGQGLNKKSLYHPKWMLWGADKFTWFDRNVMGSSKPKSMIKTFILWTKITAHISKINLTQFDLPEASSSKLSFSSSLIICFVNNFGLFFLWTRICREKGVEKSNYE